MTGPEPCCPSLRYLARFGLTSPALLVFAAAAAGAAFLLGPAAAAPSALRFGAELMAVRLRLRLGAIVLSVSASTDTGVDCSTAAELLTSLDSDPAGLATAGTVLLQLKPTP
jgi:hypothetical protein